MTWSMRDFVVIYNITKSENKSPIHYTYTLQGVKEDIISERLVNMVNAYPSGVIRFCSCLKWLRAPLKQQNETRFFYCMAISASLGLEVAETLNLNICKSQSLTETNTSYLKLIGYTGFPSLENMVYQDAYSLILQWVKLEPEMFPKPREGSKHHRDVENRKKKKLRLPIVTKDGGLVREILGLAQKHEDRIIKEAEERERRSKIYKKQPEKIDPLPPAKACLRNLLKRHKEGGWSNKFLQRMLTYESRIAFNCFEAKERLENYKEPISIIEKRTSIDNPWIIKTFKRKRSPTSDIVTRDDVTPVRIALTNRFAYLKGREETFSSDPEFLNTLTPRSSPKNSRVCDSPHKRRRVKRRAKLFNKNSEETEVKGQGKGEQKREGRGKNSEKLNKSKKRNANEAEGEDLEMLKMQTVGYDRKKTLLSFKLICNFCEKDISFEQNHVLFNCPGLNYDKTNVVKSRKKSKALSERLYEIGANFEPGDSHLQDT